MLGLNAECLQQLRYFFIEFVVHYRSERAEYEVSLSENFTYLGSVQRRLRDFKLDVFLFSGLMFAYAKYALLSVLDNKFSEQQANGRSSNSIRCLWLKT